MSFRAGVVRRGVAVWSCVALLALAGCSGGGEDTESSSEGSKDAAARESAEPSGPEDSRLQGEPLTKEQAREELCAQVVEYFPDDMVKDVTTAESENENLRGCLVGNVQFDSDVSVKFEIGALSVVLVETLSDVDAELLGDDPICEKIEFIASGPESDAEREPTSYGERPDEFCGIRFADSGHMAGDFIENRQHMVVEMWVDAPDSVEQYDVREEIMPYIMEGTKNFHSDQLSHVANVSLCLRRMLR